jgi:hypothetical protein
LAGQASGGQKLTPNPNVTAVAGVGGDKWGANGGGITPIGGGVTGAKGWDERIAATLADGQTAANYQTNSILGVATITALSQQGVGALSGSTFDDTLAVGNSNSG